MIYYNEVFQRLEKGEHLKGYIKEVREDDKIDVSLTPQGYQKVEGIAGVILEAMKTQGGYIPVHDKSDPDVIYSLFRCSKKAFKQAIGALYKQHLITLEDGGIRLVNEVTHLYKKSQWNPLQNPLTFLYKSIELANGFH